ncbi:MAG: ArsR/SmtB family transcription factor [Gemmataceae bacterium]
MDHTFFALSDPTRRTILLSLAEGEKTVAQLAEPLDISLPGVSKHLRVLEQAGLIKQERQGRSRLCRLVAEPLKEAASFVEKYRQFWETQLDKLNET